MTKKLSEIWESQKSRKAIQVTKWLPDKNSLDPWVAFFASKGIKIKIEAEKKETYCGSQMLYSLWRELTDEESEALASGKYTIVNDFLGFNPRLKPEGQYNPSGKKCWGWSGTHTRKESSKRGMNEEN